MLSSSFSNFQANSEKKSVSEDVIQICIHRGNFKSLEFGTTKKRRKKSFLLLFSFRTFLRFPKKSDLSFQLCISVKKVSR